MNIEINIIYNEIISTLNWKIPFCKYVSRMLNEEHEYMMFFSHILKFLKFDEVLCPLHNIKISHLKACKRRWSTWKDGADVINVYLILLISINVLLKNSQYLAVMITSIVQLVDQ